MLKYLDAIDTGVWKVIEIIVVGAALGYGTYVNASKVPIIQDQLAGIKTDVAVLNNDIGSLKDAVSDLRDSLRNRDHER